MSMIYGSEVGQRGAPCQLTKKCGDTPMVRTWFKLYSATGGVPAFFLRTGEPVAAARGSVALQNRERQRPGATSRR
jgi:hypothetical protein